MLGKILIIIFGSLTALLILFLSYPTYVLIKLKVGQRKIRDIYMQLIYQVDIKYNLIQLNINSKSDKLDELLKEYSSFKEKFSNEDLKKYNDAFNYYLQKSDSVDLINKCNEAEEKINYIKEYYNEVVFSFNKYKENKFNNYLAKSFSILDAKLY